MLEHKTLETFVTSHARDIVKLYIIIIYFFGA